MGKQTYIFEEILNEYKKLQKSKNKKPITNMERWVNIIETIFLIIVAIVLIISINCYKLILFFGTLGVLIVLTVVITFADQYVMNKTWDAQVKEYHDWINLLDSKLNEFNIKTIEDINIVQNWCDEYSKYEHVFVKFGKATGKICTYWVIPILLFIGQSYYTDAKSDKISIAILGIFLAVEAGIIVHVCFPAIGQWLNKKYLFAKKMKQDLEELKFIWKQKVDN